MDGYVVDFTGIKLDSDQMLARLPQDKLDRTINAVQSTLQLGYTSFKSLRSTLSFLSFCARVIALGRPFLRNLFNLARDLSYLPRPTTRRRLSTEAIQDLRWWNTLLAKWNGIRLIHQDRTITHLYTDASGTKGIGGWCPGGHAFSTRIPRRHRQKHINWKEAYAVLFAFAKWGHLWAGKQVTIMCDNSAIVDAINKRSIRCDAINPLQLLFLTAALYDINISACWLSSEDNWIADSLSRFDFKRLANFQLDRLFDFSRRELGTPMFKLRQKLQAYFGMDLRQVPDLHTPKPGLSTNISHNFTDTTPFRSPSNPSPTGSPKQWSIRNPKQSGRTSPVSAATTSIMGSPPLSSRMSESSESSVDHSANSARRQFGHAPKSPKTFSNASSTPSATITTTPIFVPHLPQPLLASFVQESSPGNPGTQQPHLSHCCLEDPSNLSTKVSSSTFLNQRPISSASVTTFRYLPLGTPAAPFGRSGHSLSATQNRPRTRYSQHPVVPSTRNGSQINSQRHFSKLASIPRHTLGTPSVVVPPTPPLQQEYLGTRSKGWVVGNRMQWIDISQSPQRRRNSSPPTAASTWPPQVRRASSDSLPTLTANHADPRNPRTPGLAFQRGCLAVDADPRASGPVFGKESQIYVSSFFPPSCGPE